MQGHLTGGAAAPFRERSSPITRRSSEITLRTSAKQIASKTRGGWLSELCGCQHPNRFLMRDKKNRRLRLRHGVEAEPTTVRMMRNNDTKKIRNISSENESSFLPWYRSGLKDY
ncbi:hypothetical protein JTB14_036339 [Gonioctena quinquepunctata]|nr:hypothetical protein JTB14_036339 [Gonioctena quinquepunctata]